MKLFKMTLVLAGGSFLAGCGMSESTLRQNYNYWVGQTAESVSGTFGYPKSTLDLAGGDKVYHYEPNKNCVMEFQINKQSIVDKVNITGNDTSDCPHKLPSGKTF